MNGDHPSGARLMLTDGTVASLLLRDARNRTTARLFGVTSDQSLVVTAIAIGSLLAAVHGRVAGILGARPNASSDGLIGVGVANVAVHAVAGPSAEQTRFLGALIGFAFVASSFGPALGGSIRALRVESRAIRRVFGSRYGG